MTNCRVYVRVSQEDEEEILKNQTANAMRYVQDTNLHLIKLYSEIASGAADSRSEFNSFMADLRPGEVAVFTSISRMTRGGLEVALEILRQLETRGVSWHFVEQTYLNMDPHTPDIVRKPMLALLTELDKEYRERIRRATKRAYTQRKTAADGAGVPVRWGRPKGSRDKKPRKPRKNGSPRSTIKASR